jgi:hypothetical protein
MLSCVRRIHNTQVWKHFLVNERSGYAQQYTHKGKPTQNDTSLVKSNTFVTMHCMFVMSCCLLFPPIVFTILVTTTLNRHSLLSMFIVVALRPKCHKRAKLRLGKCVCRRGYYGDGVSACDSMYITIYWIEQLIILR